jgi:hypothetical protein
LGLKHGGEPSGINADLALAASEKAAPAGAATMACAPNPLPAAASQRATVSIEPTSEVMRTSSLPSSGFPAGFCRT